MKDTDLKEKNRPPVIWTSVGCRVPMDMKVEFMKLAFNERYNVNQYIALLVKSVVEGRVSLDMRDQFDKTKETLKKVQDEVTVLNKNFTEAQKEISSLKSQNKAITQTKDDNQGTIQKNLTELAKLKKQLSESKKAIDTVKTETEKRIDEIKKAHDELLKKAAVDRASLTQNIKKLQDRIKAANAYIAEQESKKLFPKSVQF